MNTRTGALSGSATEIKTPVPGNCLDEFPAVRSVGILGEESAVGGAPFGSVVAPPTARRVGEISHGANPMSPAAGYPATRRSWVAPVGDACRLAKLRSRFTEIVLTNSRVSVASESSAKISPWGRSPWERCSAPHGASSWGNSPRCQPNVTFRQISGRTAISGRTRW